jgi:hypothetical protein
MPDAFNVRATYAWKPDRLYRVYVRSGQLYFIRIGGQNWALAQALEMQLGPLGDALGRSVRNRSDEKMRKRIEEADRIPPEIRVRDHAHNLRIGVEDILECEIIEPGRLASHGQRYGRWNIGLRAGKRMKLQFEVLEDMQCALDLLPAQLGDRLSVRVHWDDLLGRFVKRDDRATPIG